MPESFNPLFAALQTQIMRPCLRDRAVFNAKRLFCITPFIIPPCGGGRRPYIFINVHFFYKPSFKADLHARIWPYSFPAPASLMWMPALFFLPLLSCHTRRLFLEAEDPVDQRGDTADSTQVGAGGWGQGFEYSLRAGTGRPKSCRRCSCQHHFWFHFNEI